VRGCFAKHCITDDKRTAPLARPGGNITGLSMMLTELATKEFEIFTGALPQASSHRRFSVLATGAQHQSTIGATLLWQDA
jgi:hypothetical protein